MTVAEFNSAPHDVKIAYLMGVLSDVEKLFKHVTNDPVTFEKAVSDLKAAYGDESFISIFLYAVQPELRGPAERVLKVFGAAYEQYLGSTTRGRIVSFFAKR